MKIKKGIAVLMAVLSLTGTVTGTEKVYADEINAPYLALGADLNESEKSTVLNLLGVDASQLDQYMVVTVTNADEHAYLDAYLDASVIGSRALSSVVVEKKEEGTGIKVKTSNISYCTTGMYQNALATAGLENAEVRVAGPFNISGTAALVGAMKAYGEMTGETINPENADAATEELVITSELGESLGEQEQAEALIGAVKDIIVAEEVEDPQKIEAVINDTAKKMNIQLSEEDKAKIAGLMEKIGSLDLNVDALKEQAKDLYQKLEDMDIQISGEHVKGVLATIISWFEKAFDTIKSWLGM